MQYKNFSFEVKEVNEDEGTFMGYASVFGNVDLERDVIMPGAFTKTLRERGDRVPICWQHDWKQPIGKPILEEDNRGLLVVRGKISDTQAGRDALTLLRDGVVQDMSIGYDVIKDEYTFVDASGKECKKSKDAQRIRKLHELRLYEVSLVTVGANEQATVMAVKSWEMEHVELKGAIPYKKTPLAPKDTPWDAGAERKKCETVDELRAICALVDGDPEVKGSYKLPHHKGDGNHACVWNGVKAAAGALRGARGGVEGEGQSGARAHIGKHYKDFDETPPWESDGGESQSEEPDEKSHSEITLEAKRRELKKRLLEELVKE